jgi:hypothetical protein
MQRMKKLALAVAVNLAQTKYEHLRLMWEHRYWSSSGSTMMDLEYREIGLSGKLMER